MLPVVFLYDVSAEHSGNPTEQRAARAEWRRVMGRIRGTDADAILLSLFVDKRDVDFVVEADLDGAYTYFAARGFTEGSTPANWVQLHERMAAAGKRFVPSVGPGYNDTLIRQPTIRLERDNAAPLSSGRIPPLTSGLTPRLARPVEWSGHSRSGERRLL